MAETAASPCAGCQRLQAQLEEQRAQLEAQRAQLEQKQATVTRLEEQLAAARKDSSTSSKPPSSDIVKPPPPPPPAGQDKRQRGGQPGHPKHERARFPDDQVEHFFVHTLDSCPCCGGHRRLNKGLELLVQQVDLEPAQLTVQQHTCPEYWCVHCEKAYKADLPEHIQKGGLVGPRLTTLIEVLGEEFDGVLGCDCFGAYRRYMRECDVVLQFCLAHLIRDVKFLMKLPSKKVQAYGTRLCDALRTLFRLIHQREEMTPVQFQTQLEAAREQVLRAGTQDVPTNRHAEAMAKRLRTHGKSYFTFVTTPGVEPTNDLAEQAIRFVVIDRHITQGTRSKKGQRWCERIWTVVATCTQQGRSVFDYLCAAVRAYFGDGPAPSLLPQG